MMSIFIEATNEIRIEQKEIIIPSKFESFDDYNNVFKELIKNEAEIKDMMVDLLPLKKCNFTFDTSIRSEITVRLVLFL